MVILVITIAIINLQFKYKNNIQLLQFILKKVFLRRQNILPPTIRSTDLLINFYLLSIAKVIFIPKLLIKK